MPRPEFANTAGSQFFICLDYTRTKKLDGKYAAFGQLVNGLDVLQQIGTGAVADEWTGRPVEPVRVNAIRIVPVTAGQDPYPLKPAATTMPTN
jgi:peptidyl-prolyl cis-trans isomerase B (cyclophilin B)